MYRDTIVPQCGSLRSPFETNLDIDILLINVVKIVKYQVAFGLVQSNNRFGHSSVDEERLPTSGWVYANDRMDSLDTFWARFWIVAVEVCVSANIDSFLSVDDLSEIWAQFRVRGIAAGPQSISAKCGDSVIMQVCNARRVLFVYEVTAKLVKTLKWDGLLTCAILMRLLVV